ncbi:MAG: amidohydrolase, partial [Crocinitomicaceae bacterium]|nr:amidohydrolase [Crocinitomicaceae bacterium]
MTFVAFNFQLLSQFSPNNGVKDSEAEIIALKNVTVYISPSKRLEKATVIISKGKIVEIERNASIPKGAVVYEMEGKTIVPAFIELNSNFGLPKNGENNFSIHPKIDNNKKNGYYWNEAIHPELEAAKFYNSDSKANENYIKSGFGYALTHFQDGISRGTGALVSLGNSTTNSPILNANAATFYSFSKGSAKESYPSSQMGSIALLRQAFYDLKYYSENQVDEAAVSLEKWNNTLKLPSFFKTDDKWEILRAAKIANEFSQNFNYIGSGNEYLATKELKKLNSTLVIPINFPEAYEVKDPYIARQIPLSDLKHWELAPSNPAILKQAGINFCITLTELKSSEQFWKNLQKAISRGLSKADALASLTTNPAKLIGMEKEIGDLENGKWASFAVYTNDPFDSESTLLEMWFLGEQQIIKELPTTSILGKYSVNIDGNKYNIDVSGSNEKPLGKIQTIKSKFDPKTKQTKRDTIIQTVYV